MQRITDPTAVPDLFGPGKPGFTDGDPIAAVPTTNLNAKWFNAVQEELMAFLTAAGITPDGNNNGQVLASVRALFANRAYAEYRTYASLTAAIPVDDTIPQITEGTQILSVSLTPRSITSRFRLRYAAYAACDSVGALGFSSALFLNGGPGAIRATTVTIANNQNYAGNFIEHEYVPGVLTAQTFTIRVGAQNGYLYLNGASVRYFGGVSAATITVEEIPA